MPTYMYECRKCGAIREVFHAMSASPRVKCPQCQGACKRLIGTGAGVLFKGSGFYETDYKRRSTAASASSNSGGESSSPPSSGDTKTDTAKTKKAAND